MLVRKGLSTTKASLIKNKIPLKLLDSAVIEPGFIEADTVAHCGTSMVKIKGFASDYGNEFECGLQQSFDFGVSAFARILHTCELFGPGEGVRLLNDIYG